MATESGRSLDAMDVACQLRIEIRQAGGEPLRSLRAFQRVKLQAGQSVLGVTITTPSIEIAALTATLGFDFHLAPALQDAFAHSSHSYASPLRLNLKQLGSPLSRG